MPTGKKTVGAVSPTASTAEAVNHPQHYNFGKIEVIDYIESTLGAEGCYAFCVGNVIKYVSRARHKGKTAEDLKKAQWYLEYALKMVEAMSWEQSNSTDEVTK